MWGVIAAAVIGQVLSKKNPTMRDPPVLLYNTRENAKPESAKCPCCGSRNFIDHHSRRICMYCRSEQDDGRVHSSFMEDLHTYRSEMFKVELANQRDFLRRQNRKI